MIKSINNAARVAGALFLIQLITYFIGNQILLQNVISTSDLLNSCLANTNTLVLSVILELICATSVVGISVILYPILKIFSLRIALWYVGFRLLEFSIIAASKIKLLTLLRLSQQFENSGQQDLLYYKTLSTSLLAEHNLAILMTLIVFGLGAFSFYYLLFKSLLVPRFISLWGILGVLLVVTSALLQLYGVDVPFFIFLPMGLNEIFIGVWLVVKGFNQSVVQTLAGKER